MIYIYNFCIFCDPPLNPISAWIKESIACKTHTIHRKGSKGKDKFMPSYVPSSLFDVFIYKFYIMIQIITIMVLPRPTEHDNTEYRFLVMSSSGLIVFN